MTGNGKHSTYKHGDDIGDSISLARSPRLPPPANLRFPTTAAASPQGTTVGGKDEKLLVSMAM